MRAEFPLAVHALVYLMHKGTQELISSAELADNICTNSARVRKVMAKLHEAGLVNATRGKGSGYALAKEDITLSAVLSALNEQPVSMAWRSGDMDKACLVSSGMGDVMDGVYRQMNKQCEAYLEDVTVKDICNTLFNRA